MKKLLALESTCDETAAAVITEDLQVLGAVVASQDQLHQRYQGVVPEIAARAHLQRMLPVIDQTLRRAACSLQDLDAIAVAVTPGLAGSLLIGLATAKTLCVTLNKPLIAINHLHAHIYACRVAAARDVFPCLGLIVSGGHTSLYACRAATDFQLLGGTIDDAAGEAFDKVASLLGLGFPGGPAVARQAEHGDPRRYAFPRPFLKDRDRLQFSFSGLKTAVRYQVAGVGKQDLDAAHQQLQPTEIADVCASFQAAVVDCLIGKTRRALQLTPFPRLCVGGGVAANTVLRARVHHLAKELHIELHIAPPELCTDNAVMGAIAFEHFHAGNFAPLDLDIKPGLVR